MKKPTHFVVLKIIGFIGLVVAFIGIINLINGFHNFEGIGFMIGSFMFTIGSFVGLSCLIMGFRPEISKMTTKSAKYILEENKDDLKDVSNTTAEITSEAISKTASAIKEGFKSSIYCKYCGQKIDNDSKFCKHCGSNLE